MSKILEIIDQNRGKGNTIWLLKSAINNPNIVIVCIDLKHCQYLKNNYFKLLKKEPWYRKLKWKLFGRKHPLFKSINENFRGISKPIVFDNGTLLINYNLK